MREHVTLRRSGGSLAQGPVPLPRREEPVLQRRPTTTSYHCFGCGEGGDAISFVQKVEHLTFTESVERLAAKIGMELRYEEGGGRRERRGHRQRVPAGRGAPRRPGVLRRPAARHRQRRRPGRPRLPARPRLRRRGGHAVRDRVRPAGGEALVRHLRAKGFTGRRDGHGRARRARVTRPVRPVPRPPGLADPRHHRRHAWGSAPAASSTTTGSRRSTSTPPRPRSTRSRTVLYGLDAAKKAIARDRHRPSSSRATPTSWPATSPASRRPIATCGTAVRHRPHQDAAPHHARRGRPRTVARSSSPSTATPRGRRPPCGRSARTSAGRPSPSSPWRPSGMDPCELRQAEGGCAVAALVDDAVPMFEFAVRTTIGRFDLDTAEGRIQAMRAVAADRRPHPRPVAAAGVRPHGARGPGSASRSSRSRPRWPEGRQGRQPTRIRDPSSPRTAPRRSWSPPLDELRDALPRARPARPGRHRRAAAPAGRAPAARSARTRRAGPARRHVVQCPGAPVGVGRRRRRRPPDGSTAAWTDAVAAAAPAAVQPLVAELAVAPLPVTPDRATGLPSRRYAASLVSRLREVGLTRQIADALSQLRRGDSAPEPDPAAQRELGLRLQGLQRELADLRDQQEG